MNGEETENWREVQRKKPLSRKMKFEKAFVQFIIQGSRSEQQTCLKESCVAFFT